MTEYHATFSAALTAFMEANPDISPVQAAANVERSPAWLYAYLSKNDKPPRRTANEETIELIDEALHTVTSHVPGQGWSITKNNIVKPEKTES